MMKDEWLRAALTDDAVVAELLFHLRGVSSEEDSSPSTPSLSHPPVAWGRRLPRSKISSNFRKDSPAATRWSPTTPLSWSGGAAATASSLSDSGCDDSGASRSKGGNSTNEVTNVCSSNRRGRRRKTFSALKEEEITLLKGEGVHLKRELESVNVTLKDQRFKAGNLKRIKFDLNQQSGDTRPTPRKAGNAAWNQQHNRKEAASAVDRVLPILPRNSVKQECGVSISQEADVANKRCFVLPDLNMMPTEEEIAAEIF